MSYKTLRVHEAQQIKLERAAIEISSKIGKQVQWTDVARYMFENMLTDAKHGMIQDSKKRSVEVRVKISIEYHIGTISHY
ncbi:hypothetical protein [Vibrio parahaemolyticus]|uniref:hypothetical protein n=1 Tax=Vibrio parahaemolyticus TaxID=670 RepID=UPI001F1B13C5|nr:hypothetical protein [Vibrio parahaemolyticus]UJX31237.1 hypothetical protein JHS79_21345 [Vibrio parahaemolyticus]UJX31253.1 hypothetical protein JHS79_21445 [Vibrio parahaemolyticus]UJX31266.1 hypothetical protein JHS79_21545 [Vibrio parahaemolyticus]